MKAEPTDLDRSALRSALVSGWGVEPATMTYVPVGFGSHHYDVTDVRGSRWFVTVDDMALKPWLSPDADEAFTLLERAFGTAVRLAATGLDFVHAPTASTDGGPLVRIGPRYGVSVTGFLDGEVQDPETTRFEGTRRATVFGSLGRLHAATATLPSGLPRTDTLEITSRAALGTALDHVDQPWAGGPLSEPARAALRIGAASVRDRLGRFDDLAATVRSDGRPLVVTHGEPHPGNVIWRADGGHALIDWDTTAIAPPERDLWMLAPTDADLEGYASAGGRDDVRIEALTAYREWWDLSEIAMSIETLRAAHTDDANTRASLDGLLHYLGP